MTDLPPRDSAAGRSRGRRPEAASDDPTEVDRQLARLRTSLHSLEDTVARGIPALEQQILRVESELPRVIREHGRGLPDWAEALLERHSGPLERLVRRSRESTARALQRLHGIHAGMRGLSDRLERLTEEFADDDPRVVGLEDRLGRTARVLEETRSDVVHRIENVSADLNACFDRLADLDGRTDRAIARLDARMDASERRWRRELDRRMNELPRLEARLREHFGAEQQAARGKELEQNERLHRELRELRAASRRHADNVEAALGEDLDTIRSALEALRGARHEESADLHERFEDAIRGMEEPVQRLESRFDAAILEERRKALWWRATTLVLFGLLVLWQLLER